MTIYARLQISILAVFFGLTACSQSNDGSASHHEADLATEIATAPGRSDEDKARDAQRKPAEVLAFLGLKRGDTVLDVWASGGWYTEVLSIAVGADGRVYSQNSPIVLEFRDGFYDKALTARLAENRLTNVHRLDESLQEISLEPESVDLVITALNFHDVYNRQGAAAAEAWLTSILDVLKPGGTLGLIDHVGDTEADNESLHRLELSLVKAAAATAGFILEAESDLLSHPEDDHSKMVFDETIRGKTDRFILRLRKPE